MLLLQIRGRGRGQVQRNAGLKRERITRRHQRTAARSAAPATRRRRRVPRLMRRAAWLGPARRGKRVANVRGNACGDLNGRKGREECARGRCSSSCNLGTGVRVGERVRGGTHWARLRRSRRTTHALACARYSTWSRWSSCASLRRQWRARTGARQSEGARVSRAKRKKCCEG